MKQVELGKLCDHNSERDAIHLALYPCIAGETLQPGQRVGISKVSGNALAALPWIGVVDPFLTHPIEKGMRFWLCIRPGEVTGLRHVYSHPAFDRSEAKATRTGITEYPVYLRDGKQIAIAEESYEAAIQKAIDDGHDVEAWSVRIAEDFRNARKGTT